MASDFDEAFSEGLSENFSAFGSAAVCICKSGEQFGADVDVIEGVESFTPSGDIQGGETHLELMKRDILPGFGSGGMVQLPDRLWRLDRRISDDGLVVRYLVAPLSNHDHEQIKKVQQPLRRVVHEEW